MKFRNGINLESASIKGFNGFDAEVRKGSEVYLVDPEDFKDRIKSVKQKENNQKIMDEIGKPPYIVEKITKYPVGPTFMIAFDVWGKKGSKKNLSSSYFMRY